MQSIARCANFNPRTPCGVRLTPQTALAYMLDISIHVPRAGCDLHLDLHGLVFVISIHVPRAGCDRSSVHSSLISGSFQSTYPVRGATRQRYRHDHPAHISIHVPRAGCDRPRSSCPDPARAISIHVPRAGCDIAGFFVVDDTGLISIHVPRAGCDALAVQRLARVAISIHVPRAGCDGKFDDFNPLNLHKRYKRVLDRPKSTSEQGKNKAKLAYIHVFTVFLGGAKVPELSARFYFAPNTVRLSARPWRHSPLWHRNARCGCDTYPQGSKSAGCPRIHP